MFLLCNSAGDFRELSPHPPLNIHRFLYRSQFQCSKVFWTVLILKDSFSKVFYFKFRLLITETNGECWVVDVGAAGDFIVPILWYWTFVAKGDSPVWCALRNRSTVFLTRGVLINLREKIKYFYRDVPLINLVIGVFEGHVSLFAKIIYWSDWKRWIETCGSRE